MKKSSYLVAALLMACATPCLTSCFVGSFSCVNTMWQWNSRISDNKIVNAVIGFILGPFETSIGGFLDTVIFNSLEFWTGSNPLAATQVVEGTDGNLYAISSNKEGGYIITCQQTGQQMEYIFDADNHAWTAAFDGQQVKLFSLTSPDVAVVETPVGSDLTISLDEQGLFALQQQYSADSYLALQ